MRTRSFVVVLLALSFLLSALPGCGEKEKKDDKKKKSSEPAAAPAPAPDVEQPISLAEEKRRKLVAALELKEKMTATPKDVGAPPASATKTKSGMWWKLLREGTGKSRPNRDAVVWVHYSSWATDGGLMHSTWKKGKTRKIDLNRAVKGWREALSMMVVGERRRFWIPPKLAHVRRKRKKRGMRVIDFEMVRIKQGVPAPKDVKRPPRDAKKSKSGLYTKQLTAGTGTAHPKADGQATVRYAGWTTDGRNFDSTDGEETQTFSLANVIPGWKEAIPRMVVGEKVRIWVPKKLAYDGMDGKPQGMLVFDVELVEIPE